MLRLSKRLIWSLTINTMQHPSWSRPIFSTPEIINITSANQRNNPKCRSQIRYGEDSPKFVTVNEISASAWIDSSGFCRDECKLDGFLRTFIRYESRIARGRSGEIRWRGSKKRIGTTRAFIWEIGRKPKSSSSFLESADGIVDSLGGEFSRKHRV